MIDNSMRLTNCKKNSYLSFGSSLLVRPWSFNFKKKNIKSKEGLEILCLPHCNCCGVFFTLNHICSTKLLSGLENSFSLLLASRMTKLVIFVCLMLRSLARAQDQGKYSQFQIYVGRINRQEIFSTPVYFFDNENIFQMY